MTAPPREPMIAVMAALAAAISLLERGGKKAAPSDKMFSIMLNDYRRALDDARAAWDAAPAPPVAQPAEPPTPDAITAAVDRFLSWPLPKTFSPDCGIRFDGRVPDQWNDNKTWPIGTNLFTAEQTREMFTHCLATPVAQPAEPPAPDDLDNQDRAKAAADAYMGLTDQPASMSPTLGSGPSQEGTGRSDADPTAAPAQGDPQDYDALVRRLQLSTEFGGWAWLHKAANANVIAALRAENERYAREISRGKEHLTRELTVALAERDALRLMVKDDAQWAQENERLTRERDELRTMLRTANAAAAKLATIADHAKADLFKANIDSANLLAERSDMSVDIEKYRREIAELKSELNETQRAGVTTANYWKDRAELAEDQRERTRDVWATRAERAEAKREALRECVRAADAMRAECDQVPPMVQQRNALHAYDTARAKVKP